MDPADNDTLLLAKLFIPGPAPDIVPRPHLQSRLEAGLSARLTLVSAPAGFGKTTLLSAWAQQCSRPVAWISLDEGDNDPARFTAYLVRALHPILPSLDLSFETSQFGLPDAASPFSGLETQLVSLLNSLLKAPPFVLVLDDYHCIQNTEIHSAVAYLIAHQTASMHLVISTRSDPPLSLPRLRVRGQLNEIREAELRFGGKETKALVEGTSGAQLTAEALTTLEAKTEGWAAALKLAALSLKDSQNFAARIAAFSGDDRHVFDYLAAEVLDHLPTTIQIFLLRTSILNRLSADLCAALLIDLDLPTSSQTLLEQLEARNLFLIPLDRQRHWFRYHQLFAEFLRSRMRQTAPKLLDELHRRASRRFAEAKDLDQAVYHAFEASDLPFVVHLLEQYGAWFINQGQTNTLASWLDRIPEEVVAASPYLCLGAAWAYALNQRTAEAEKWLARCEAGLAGFEPCEIAGEGRVVTEADIRADMLTVRAFTARLQGDLAQGLAYSQQAYERLSPDDEAARSALALNLGLLHLEAMDWAEADRAFAQAREVALQGEGNLYLALSALHLQGDALLEMGALRRAEACYRRAIELGSRKTGPAAIFPLSGLSRLGLANVQLLRFELETARQHLDQALDFAGLARSDPRSGALELAGAMFAARLSLAAGDLIAAENALDRAAERAAERAADLAGPQPDDEPGFFLAVLRGELALRRKDPAGAAQRLEEAGLTPDDLMKPDAGGLETWKRLPAYLLYQRLLLAQEKSGAALQFADGLVRTAEASGRQVLLIEALALAAEAYESQNRSATARRLLARALSLAEPEELLRPFMQPAGGLKGLLLNLLSEGSHTHLIQRILAQGTPDTGISSPQAYETLTERELQVLRLLAAGLSSTEAAEELVLAVSTVRSYIKSIYRKLDAHSRDEAITNAQRLSLL